MPSAPKDPDERRKPPSWFASQLGWPRTAAGWSWESLLDLAERRYHDNKARVDAERAA
jgi:hypothetical protein